MNKNNSVVGMVVKLCLAFMGATLGAVYFILNFTVAPLSRDVKDIWKKVYAIDVKMESIKLLLTNHTAQKFKSSEKITTNLDSLEESLKDTIALKYPKFIQKEIKND